MTQKAKQPISYLISDPVLANQVAQAQNQLLAHDNRKAIKLCERVLNKNSSILPAYYILSRAYLEIGKSREALSASINCLNLDSTNEAFQLNFLNTLDRSGLLSYETGIWRALVLCIDSKSLETRVIKATGYQLELKLRSLSVDDYNALNVTSLISSHFSEPLVLKMLSDSICTFPTIEKYLTLIRKLLLESILQNTAHEGNHAFLFALACQCFNNNYCYFTTTEEYSGYANLVETLLGEDSNQDKISTILIFCTYVALSPNDSVFPSAKQYITSSEYIADIYRLCIENGEVENLLSKDLKEIAAVKDVTSIKVQSQYEQRPYPVWTSIDKPHPLQKRLQANGVSTENLANLKLENILIAGCGTGKHPIGLALAHPETSITAIDLSRSSLSYAMRMAKKYKLKNINFYHGDLQSIGLLNQTFDLIECVGVLHHMASPDAGLAALLEVLHEGGFIKLGLYSHMARQPVVLAREYICSKGIDDSDESLRSFRHAVLSREFPEFQEIEKTADFYTLNTLKDFIFHEQEIRYEFKDIEALIERFALNFRCFEFARPTKEFVKIKFPGYRIEGKLQSLGEWRELENKNPQIFKGMYQFWCQR